MYDVSVRQHSMSQLSSPTPLPQFCLIASQRRHQASPDHHRRTGHWPAPELKLILLPLGLDPPHPPLHGARRTAYICQPKLGLGD